MITGADAIPLGTLLTARVFEVPKYQRAYAWEADEVDDYVRDLNRLAEARASGNQAPPHFFGGLVSIDIQTGDVAAGIKFEVVDGQQRLATFFLTVAAIARGLRRVGADAQAQGDAAIEVQAEGHAGALESDCLNHTVVRTTGPVVRLRLRLSRADDRFFNELVDDDPNRDPDQRSSTKRLDMAADRIKEGLIETALLGVTSLQDQLNALLRLRDSLLHDGQIIHIRSNDRREAYRLFSVLNDRGRSLSAGDLLRSHSLELLESHVAEQNAIEPEWDEVLRFEEAQVDQFLKSYFSSFSGRRPSKTELWVDVRDEFFAQALPVQAQGAGEIRDRVRRMRIESDWFDSIRSGEWPFDPPAAAAWDQNRLARIARTLRHDLCFPLLLAVRAKRSETEFTEAVLLLDRFVFRYISIVGASASKLSTRYISNAEQIRTNPAWTVSDLQQDLCTLQQADASDALFKVRLAEQLVYGVPSQRQALKYFLTTVEDHLASARAGTNPAQASKMAIFDLDSITIEHIYPRNPQPGEGDPAVDPVKNALGNLTFWASTDNQAAANQSFAAKKQAPYYPNSAVQLTSELAGEPAWKQTGDWTLADLESRRDDMIAIALRVFTAA